jgi:hypothetical protein
MTGHVAPSDQEELFMRLSEVLTGEPQLDAALGPGLVQRLKVTPEAAHLDRLLAAYRAIETEGGDPVPLVAERIMSDADLRALVTMIIILWFTADLKSRDLTIVSPPTPEQHFGGLLWRVARAHPPGLSGGYYGHWTYPPDNV